MFVYSSKKDDSGHPIGYVVYFARTPVEVKETTEDDEDGDDLEVVIKNIKEVDPEWMMEHAKQGETLPLVPECHRSCSGLTFSS